ncbi:MAG: hypothetical protein IJD48_04625 [Clostridia bacterium]|nr:hypothetical protein [Clostridia bacterium]
MKKLSKIMACFAMGVLGLIGLTGCTTEEIKKNTASAVESSTGVVAIEYSQGLARDLLSYAIGNMYNSAYSMFIEVKTYNSDHYISSYTSVGSYVYNKTDYTICVPDNFIIENSKKVEYTCSSIVTKLLDTDTGIGDYYYLVTAVSNEEEPKIIKTYQQTTTIGIGPGDLTYLLPNIKSGMCYLDGYSYVNAEISNYNGQEGTNALISVKIKDGLIHELTGTVLDDRGSVAIVEHYAIAYKDLPEIPEHPQTKQELGDLGYVEGNIWEMVEEEQ